MAKLLEWLESKLGGGESGVKRVRTFQWLIIMGLVGVSLMIVNAFLHVESVDMEPDRAASPHPEQEVFLKQEPAETPFSEYERTYESRLKEILEKIVGVGGVEVMVIIESTEESVVYQDFRESEQVTNERDGSAQRHITSVTNDGTIALYSVSGDNKPIILKQIKPQVRGVLIVANGAENSVVKQMLLEAVQRGLNVPPTRISVLPRKT